ncbi:hypothetical protein Hdeb2414_s1318g01009751 [Helianthus debilis subsp. tardiflorus]
MMAQGCLLGNVLAPDRKCYFKLQRVESAYRALLACCGVGTRPISIINPTKCSTWVAEGYFGTDGSLVCLALINV